MREIYLPAFEAAVKDAHVGAVMNSYNLVNGVHLTQNKIVDTEILKKEWGFQGVLMSDWFSTYDGVAAANAGLDLEMPAGPVHEPTNSSAGGARRQSIGCANRRQSAAHLTARREVAVARQGSDGSCGSRATTWMAARLRLTPHVRASCC